MWFDITNVVHFLSSLPLCLCVCVPLSPSLSFPLLISLHPLSNLYRFCSYFLRYIFNCFSLPPLCLCVLFISLSLSLSLCVSLLFSTLLMPLSVHALSISLSSLFRLSLLLNLSNIVKTYSLFRYLTIIS
jgi:hypothetical protein